MLGLLLAGGSLQLSKTTMHVVHMVVTHAGGYCWHDALCQPNPSRSAYTPGGGGRQPGAASHVNRDTAYVTVCLHVCHLGSNLQ